MKCEHKETEVLFENDDTCYTIQWCSYCGSIAKGHGSFEKSDWRLPKKYSSKRNNAED